MGWASFLSKGTRRRQPRPLRRGRLVLRGAAKFLAPRLHLVFATADDLMVRRVARYATRPAPAHMLVFVFAAAGSGGDALVQALHAHGATQSRLAASDTTTASSSS